MRTFKKKMSDCFGFIARVTETTLFDADKHLHSIHRGANARALSFVCSHHAAVRHVRIARDVTGWQCL